MKHVLTRIAELKEEIADGESALDAMDGFYTPRKFEIVENLKLRRDELQSLENFLAMRKKDAENQTHGNQSSL